MPALFIPILRYLPEAGGGFWAGWALGLTPHNHPDLHTHTQPFFLSMFCRLQQLVARKLLSHPVQPI